MSPYPPLQPPEPPNPVPVGLTLDSVLGEWTQRGQCPESEPEPSDVSLLSKIKALYPWSREGCWTAPGYPLSDFQKGKQGHRKERDCQVMKSKAHTRALGPDQATPHQASSFYAPYSRQAQLWAQVDG